MYLFSTGAVLRALHKAERGEESCSVQLREMSAPGHVPWSPWERARAPRRLRLQNALHTLHQQVSASCSQLSNDDGKNWLYAPIQNIGAQCPFGSLEENRLYAPMLWIGAQSKFLPWFFVLQTFFFVSQTLRFMPDERTVVSFFILSVHRSFFKVCARFILQHIMHHICLSFLPCPLWPLICFLV